MERTDYALISPVGTVMVTFADQSLAIKRAQELVSRVPGIRVERLIYRLEREQVWEAAA